MILIYLYIVILQILFHWMVKQGHWLHVKLGCSIAVQDHTILMLKTTAHLSSFIGSNRPICVIPHTALVIYFIKNHDDINWFYLTESVCLPIHLSVCLAFCPFVLPSVCSTVLMLTSYIYHFFSKITDQFQQNVTQVIIYERAFNFVKIKGHALFYLRFYKYF